MASKARHLRSGVNHQTISIDQLFNAAFGPSPAHYRHESLMGWRPVSSKHLAMQDFRQAHPSIAEQGQRDNQAGIHIHETSERILVEVELPAIKADTLYLEIAGDLLIVRGERIIEQHNGSRRADKGPLVHRYVQLPVVASPGQVRARLDGNTVRVRIHKQPKFK